jgi:hypothetical protein
MIRLLLPQAVVCPGQYPTPLVSCGSHQQTNHPSVQLIPQIWTNWRTKNTEGLPGLMMFLWALCASLNYWSLGVVPFTD